MTLNGPAPWGFRLQGGKDFNMPLTISRVRTEPPSQADICHDKASDILRIIDIDKVTHNQSKLTKRKAA